MRQRQYGFIGYPMYGLLFATVISGLLPGLASPLRGHPSLENLVADAEPGWLSWSLISMTMFVCVASWKVIFGSLTMVGY